MKKILLIGGALLALGAKQPAALPIAPRPVVVAPPPPVVVAPIAPAAEPEPLQFADEPLVLDSVAVTEAGALQPPLRHSKSNETGVLAPEQSRYSRNRTLYWLPPSEV